MVLMLLFPFPLYHRLHRVYQEISFEKCWQACTVLQLNCLAERTSYTSFPPIIPVYSFLICVPLVQITVQPYKMEVNVISKCIVSTLKPSFRRVLKHTSKAEISFSIDVSFTVKTIHILNKQSFLICQKRVCSVCN